jgi:hypothetical protein
MGEGLVAMVMGIFLSAGCNSDDSFRITQIQRLTVVSQRCTAIPNLEIDDRQMPLAIEIAATQTKPAFAG